MTDTCNSLYNFSHASEIISRIQNHYEFDQAFDGADVFYFMFAVDSIFLIFTYGFIYVNWEKNIEKVSNALLS